MRPNDRLKGCRSAIGHSRRLRPFVTLLVLAVSSFAPANADVKRQKFGQWTKECLIKEGKKDRCHIAQTLVDNKGRKIVYFIVGSKDGGPYLEVSAPLGIYIPAGISVRVDNRKGAAMELVDCNRMGCRAVLPLTSAKLDQLRRGKHIAIDFVDSKSGKKLSVKVSLKGFGTAAKSLGM